jgi:DNA ligase-1
LKRFATLYEVLDRTTSTNEKVAALAAYFADAPAEDAAWAVFFLTGQRFKRLLPARSLAAWAMQAAAVPEWLFEESYASVGDLAETVSLLLDGIRLDGITAEPAPDLPLSVWITGRLLPLRDMPPEEQERQVTGWWAGLGRWETFVLNKMLTGALRVGVSQTLVERALARVAGVDPAVVAHRLMGAWKPTAEAYRELLVSEAGAGEDASRPYPFFLASPLEDPPETLGPTPEWQVEWKWDGIRAQVLRRQGMVWIWSRGEELITERFPELERTAWSLLPDGTVLDGEIMAWRDGGPLPFSTLQRRIGRKRLTDKVLAEAPAAFVVYDLLEEGGRDARERPLADRRAALERLVGPARPLFLPSPRIEAADWADVARAREEARGRGVEGLMLKRLASPYRSGRRRGDWWKWKIDPHTVDAVLIYAQSGHGRRANLLTDYTFAVWSGGELVPVAKAYSGLSDPEILELDSWLRRHTVQKFGPVRSVEPLQVFELAFEGIALSPRHRSGVAVRFPRIARWRKDKKPEEADTLEGLKGLIGGSGDV